MMKPTDNEVWPTPTFSSMTPDDKLRVYEPAEDTMLFIDALEKDMHFLQARSPLVVLEVGCGSGVVSVFCAKILQATCFHLCTDVNPAATLVAQKVAAENGVSLNIVASDLMSAFGNRLKGLVDVLLFNPPYVVTPSEEVGMPGITSSWAGGSRGREVMDRMFPLAREVLSESGVFYLIALKENAIGEIEETMNQLGFSMDDLIMRRSGPEELHVLRFQRPEKSS